MQAASSRKTPPRKTYRERQQAREQMDKAVHALYTECEFRPCDFFDFRLGNIAQAGTLVLSRTDPDGRYLVLQTWPDVAGDHTKSTWQAICPPGRESQAQAVCLAVRAFNGNAYGKRVRAEVEAKRAEVEAKPKEDAIISASVREIEQRTGLGEAVK